MPKLQKVGLTTVSWGGGRAEPTDAELAERIRSRGTVGHRPESELKQRHLAYAVTCAQLCTRGRTAADRLAHEALDRAAEAARSGIDPPGTWRHFILTHVHHTARSWARTGRRALLRPSFLTWANDHGGGDGWPDGTPAESGEKQALRNGFFALPEAARGVLWYSFVDQEPDERVATYVGVAPHDVPALRAKARKALRDAFLQAHAELAGDTRCNGFRRLIEAAAVADDSLRCGDLALHLDTCLACEGLLTQLILLSDDLRTALADGLLARDGAAYASAVAQGRRTSESGPLHSAGTESGDTAGRPGSADGAAHALRPPRRGARVAGAVAAVAAVSVPLLLIAARHSGEETGADRGRAEGRPSASATPSSAATGPTQPGAGSTLPPGDLVYGRIVHKGSGLCLDIEDGVLTKRGGAVAAPCTQALTQRWALDAQGRLHNRDDSTFCLKADGDGAGVGVRPCSSDNPEKLNKMAFLVEPAGTIRPRSAPTVALVPNPEWVDSPIPLELRAVNDRSDQRWTVESLASATPGGAAGGP
ncbi:ricin-type beta-trefoil lectin domain protein [Streptomyces sp. HNM0645]|uniref:ricin-type beta-trefoil lectin domain protein n=1 Tax=Streptomyces sp. HNM0645 TaxID=2782343 RepID=UPI0024B7457C|nr:ricin-type beta-trefoil lectin domain protein [Streptomyces sp. HNM0645]MDI9884538.1 ricin-type beta-trefoil lectin domain protein [Streptomyces sp. HNM0645]